MSEAMKWLRQCARDPRSPTGLTTAQLGMLTGQDKAALEAIGLCWQLYAVGDTDGQWAAIRAVRALLPGMQEKCHFFARELIAWQLDWSDRAPVWAMVQHVEMT